jgi:hypothetical protein
VRLDPVEAAKQARELARACFAVPAGHARDEFLWSDVAPRVAWNADSSHGAPSDLSVSQMLIAAQHLEGVLVDAADRDGLGTSEDLLAAVLEFLLTADQASPVLAALNAVSTANEPIRAAARPRIGARRRFARAVDSTAPSVRAAHAQLRQAIANDPVLGRKP